MRSLLLLSVVFAFIAAATSAQAERRTFIIANNPDGYGVDRCLAAGQKCGAAMANSFCRSRDFKRAASFRRVARGEFAGNAPRDAYACSGPRCEQFVAIECVR